MTHLKRKFMADSDSALILEILTKYVGAEKAQAAIADLQKTKEKVKEVADETERYNATLKKMADAQEESSQETSNLGGKLQEYKAQKLQADSEIADSVHIATQAEIDSATAISEADAETVASKETVRGALRGLGMEFPILHRIARIATNGIALSFATVAAAIAIWRERIKSANEEAARLEMPDFQIDKINKASEAWNGLATAKSAADAAFNSANEIYSRAIKDLKEILELQKQKLENEKKTALRELEAHKKELTPDAYESAKTRIEAAFGQTELKLTQTREVKN